MVCYTPLTAYRAKEVGSSGKRGITFDRNSAFSGLPMKLPCGQCTGCRLDHSFQWGMRCVHESKMHTDNCFLTLTYDDATLPEGGTLVRRDPQLFLKRLRKRFGHGIRFYGCGEYGDTTRRPHYHFVLFGHDFADKSFYKTTRSGFKLYTSDICRELWPFGHNVIGDVCFDTAAYVARYVVKKVTGDMAGSHYQVVDADGVVTDLLPEFPMMSRRPGIGLSYFEKFSKEVYAADSVVINGYERKPPRYYDGKFEIVDSKRLDKLKRKRLRRAYRLARADSKFETKRGYKRSSVREAVAIAKLSINRREL